MHIHTKKKFLKIFDEGAKNNYSVNIHPQT